MIFTKYSLPIASHLSSFRHVSLSTCVLPLVTFLPGLLPHVPVLWAITRAAPVKFRVMLLIVSWQAGAMVPLCLQRKLLPSHPPDLRLFGTASLSQIAAAMQFVILVRSYFSLGMGNLKSPIPWGMAAGAGVGAAGSL